jgi:tetratricopeptide (TPR) repeat protein
LFSRQAPEVNEAAAAIRSRDAGVALRLLHGYLATDCKSGVLGNSEGVSHSPQAGFDLGLALFQVAERYGGPVDGATGEAAADPNALRRSEEIACALSAIQNILDQEALSIEERAQANYLAGNLEFLRPDYAAAVEYYDRALELVPAEEDPEALEYARFAAYNRALALRREEERDPPPEADGGTPDDDGDEDDSKKRDGGSPENSESDSDEEDEEDDSNQDDSKEDDQGGDEDEQKPDDSSDSQKDETEDEQSQSAANEQPPAQAPEPGATNQDDKVLDLLEQAPTFQQHEASKQRRRIIRGMEDK